MTKQKIPTTGEVLENDSIIEIIYNSEKGKTEFVVCDTQKIVTCDQYKACGKVYVPYSADNTLIKNKVVLLPSEAKRYGSQKQLADEIQNYIHKYVDLDPLFEKLCTAYIMLSWVYDGFNQLPYFRKVGDFGTGKTRFLTVIGSVCYKPIFASGSSSTPAIFHILDKFRGTLVLDEADFRYSDEKADLTKVLNNGFTKGYPVLRCAFNKNREFDPIGYQVYGCKVLASRKHFTDPALESRFITEKTSFRKLRKDIPNELPDSFDKQTLELRNMLLRYRLDMLREISFFKNDRKIEDVEPRVNQIFSPLLELACDDEFEQEILTLAKQYSKQIQKDRSVQIEYHVLSAIKSLISEGRDKISIGDISHFVFVEYSDFHDRKITAKWIGYVVSKTLVLNTVKSGGRFYLSDNTDLLKTLYARYGV